MRSYELVHQLLNLVEAFESENNRSATLPEFAGYLVNHIQEANDLRPSPDPRFGTTEEEAQSIGYQIDNNISKLVIFMSRYAKSYIKKALEGTPLQTAEEFTCLALLLTNTDLSKTELISRNIQEKTSGTEVIRRLILAGLIKQSDDKNDKRGKRVAITREGREMMYQIFERTSQVGKIVTGKLSLTEKLTLQHLLQKLEDFHYPIHENKSINSKEDLKVWAESLS